MTTINRCRNFYNSIVEPAIHEHFPEYEGRIAAGLAGEGSECFGYDDEYSQDHDFGISVCLWLTDEDYEKIGTELSDLYSGLVSDRCRGTRLEYRRGVQRISDFYRNLLGTKINTAAPQITDAQWFYTDDWKFAASVNGEIFRDDLGQFSRVRELISPQIKR